MSDTRLSSDAEAPPSGDASALQLEVFTSPTRETPRVGGTFPPTTATLILGPTEAILVDAACVDEDVDALGEKIAASGRRLTTIFITHGHFDHYFGAARLLARFPDARVVATRSVATHITETVEQEIKTAAWIFGNQVTPPSVLPSALEQDVLVINGYELKIIELERGDIAPTAAVHVPDRNAVIAGDVLYNEIHPMLALGGPTEWHAWTRSIDQIASLRPHITIAGHKKSGASDAAADILRLTRAYIDDFSGAVATQTSTKDVVDLICAEYPDYGNLPTLLFSAQTAMKNKRSSSVQHSPSAALSRPQ